MGDVVSDGTSFGCAIGTAKLKITVLSSSSEGESKKLANEGNYMFPPPPGGLCQIPGVVPPPPCVPPDVATLMPGQSPVTIDGKKALGAGCMLQCKMFPAGILTVSSSGQGASIHDGAGAGKSVEAVDAVEVVDAGAQETAKAAPPS